MKEQCQILKNENSIPKWNLPCVLQGEGATVCGSYLLKKNGTLLSFPIPKEYVTNYICMAYRKDNRKKELELLLSSVRGDGS